jgi:hypothetical protein
MRWLAGAGAITAMFLTSPGAVASDHNEPSPDPVWPAENALHKEWDLSDLFAWYDAESDKLNVIIAWHPQQLPLDAGEQVQYSDQVLFKLHLRYERKGIQIVRDRYLEREITFRYGQNEDGAWGMLVQGLPGTPAVVLDTASEHGWVGHTLEVGTGKPTNDALEGIQVATGMWDDPFVFDLDGFNDSLSRALHGDPGLRFDPSRDTFEGLNVTGIVVSIPLRAFEDHWRDFNPSGLLATNKINVWATTYITADEANRER